MSYADYRTALLNIAHAEADGEDVCISIAHIAGEIGMDAANVRQDVTEIADLIG